MRKLFLMIANSKDKKEKLIKSLQENELLGTDEKKENHGSNKNHA